MENLPLRITFLFIFSFASLTDYYSFYSFFFFPFIWYIASVGLLPLVLSLSGYRTCWFRQFHVQKKIKEKIKMFSYKLWACDHLFVVDVQPHVVLKNSSSWWSRTLSALPCPASPHPVSWRSSCFRHVLSRDHVTSVAKEGCATHAHRVSGQETPWDIGEICDLRFRSVSSRE